MSKDKKQDSHIESISEQLVMLFLHSISKENNTDWLIKLYPEQSQKTIYIEHLAFEQFIIITALASYYKDNSDGPLISQKFSDIVAGAIIDSSLFNNGEEYISFIRQRMSSYTEAASTKKEPNYIYWIGKTFSLYLGEPDPIKTLSISQYYVSMFKAYMEIIKKL